MNISGFSFSSDDMLLVGSDYFFHNCEGYIPHDYDYIILIDKANSSYKPSFDSKDTLHIYSSHTKCDKTFYYRYEKQDFIDDIVNGIVPKYFLNKFLVPEVNEAIGFEFSELHALNYLFDELDDKHKYLKIIYDSYIENDEYYLSDSQRELAFNEYKKYRDIYNK